MLQPKNKRAKRRLFAFATVLAGVALILLELFAFKSTGGEVWFWLVVGGFAIAIGLAELLSSPPKE